MVKKFSKVVPKPKHEDINGDQVDDEAEDEVPIEESNELGVENIPEEERKGESPQRETSPDQSVTQDVKGSAKKRRNKKKKRKSESPVAETSPEKSLTEDVKSPVKKRKMKENESECSQVEMSPEKSVTEDVENPKKRRKRRKKKKAMVTGNSETSEVLISPNSVSTSDASSVQVKDNAQKRKLEQTHTDDGASPPKERRLGPTGLTRAQRKRRGRKRNKQKLAEGGQEVMATASGKVPSVAQEKPPQNQTAKENQSSPTFADKLASKKASRKKKKKLVNGSVAEDSVPQIVRESRDVVQSATSEKSQLSKESKPQGKAAKIKGKLASESPQGETSVTRDVKGSAKKMKKKKKRKSESSLAETSTEKSLTESVKSPVKRIMKENESECSQVETSPEKTVTEDVESPKKRRKRRKKKKAMVTGNSETSEVLISPNSVSTSDKSSMQVKDKAKKGKLEQTHTDDGALTPKERHLGPTGLTRAQKRRRNRIRNKKKLAEGGQEVTANASGKAPSVAQEKPPQNQIAKENQSSPTFADKLASKKAKRHRKKKKIGIVSEKPNGDGPSADPEVVPGEKKKKRRKNKLANGSVAVWQNRRGIQYRKECGKVAMYANRRQVKNLKCPRKANHR